VVIHAGFGLGPWTARNLESSGLGGAETAVARMAAELRRRRHRVVVFVPAGGIDETVDGVDYRDCRGFGSFCNVYAPDVLIVSRDASVLDASVRATRRFFWAHEVSAWRAADNGQDRMRRHYGSLDAIFCLSEWHRDVFARAHRIPTAKIVVTRNGIDRERFAMRVRRKRNRFIYSSTPERGLETLLRLFPRIRAKLPGAELHVFYGFGFWDGTLRPRKQRWRDAIRSALDQPGVLWHGPVGQRRLAREMLASDVWLYPTHCMETYCITALEAQMAGVICICSDLAALRTTVGERGILLGHPDSAGFEQRAVRETVALLRDRPRRRRMAAAARRWAAQQTWGALAETWIRWFESPELLR